jgi:hypothetical protein
MRTKFDSISPTHPRTLKSLRNRDKTEDDALAQLSDQVMALTSRMQEIEKTTSVN